MAVLSDSPVGPTDSNRFIITESHPLKYFILCFIMLKQMKLQLKKLEKCCSTEQCYTNIHVFLIYLYFFVYDWFMAKVIFVKHIFMCRNLSSNSLGGNIPAGLGQKSLVKL